MTTHTVPPTDEPARLPERVGDFDVPADVVVRIAEAEDRDADEEGYGYGV